MSVIINHQILAGVGNGQVLAYDPVGTPPATVNFFPPSVFRQVFYGGDAIYAVENDPNAPGGSVLTWFRYDWSGFSPNDPGNHWQGPRRVNVAWNYKQVFTSFSEFPGAPAAYLYGITTEGRLTWAQHLGWADGQGTGAPGDPSWKGGADQVVGTDWGNYKQVFSTQDIIYAIENDGTLLWFKHLGQYNGTNCWDGPHAVGRGWQDYQTVYATSLGPATPDNPTAYLFAVQPDGTVLVLAHYGWRTGVGVNEPGQNWSDPEVLDVQNVGKPLFLFARTSALLL